MFVLNYKNFIDFALYNNDGIQYKIYEKYKKIS